MAAGENWISDDGTPNSLIDQRKTFVDHEDVVNYITDIENSRFVLVVVIHEDEDGNEYYVVWLDVDS